MGLRLYFAGQLILNFGFLRHEKYSFKSVADSRREAQLLVLDASQLFNCSHSFYNHKANKTGFVAHFITRKGIKKAEFPLQSHATLRLLDQSVACNPPLEIRCKQGWKKSTAKSVHETQLSLPPPGSRFHRRAQELIQMMQSLPLRA